MVHILENYLHLRGPPSAPRENLASLSMVEIVKMEREHYWIHRINSCTVLGARDEADVIISELSRQGGFGIQL